MAEVLVNREWFPGRLRPLSFGDAGCDGGAQMRLIGRPDRDKQTSSCLEPKVLRLMVNTPHGLCEHKVHSHADGREIAFDDCEL